MLFEDENEKSSLNSLTINSSSTYGAADISERKVLT